jgi:hypothetical protein
MTMSYERAFEVDAKSRRWVWVGAFAVTAIFGYRLTPWDTIESLLNSGGRVGDDQAQLIAFAAGYTLPATVGFALTFYLFQRGVFATMNIQVVVASIGAIFLGAAFLSSVFGLGLMPDVATQVPPTGPPMLRFGGWVLGAYLQSYGVGLMFTAAAIGFASAVQLDAWVAEDQPASAAA